MLVRVSRRPLYSPTLRELFGLENEVDSIASSIFPPPGHEARTSYDVVENGNGSVITLELAGVSKDDVKISLNEGTLIITGVRKPAGLPEGAKWLRRELREGHFTHTLSLPHEVDTSKISAEMRDGILRVNLPKSQQALPKEIKIN